MGSVASAKSIEYYETIPSVVMIKSFDSYGDEIYGSGFFMSNDSYILTVSHLIIDESTNEPFENIQICNIDDEFSTPSCKYSAAVIAYDTEIDLAILAPEYYLDKEFNVSSREVDINNLDHSYIDFADYLPKIGEKITILGFPNASQLSSITLTEGIVSGFSRDENGNVNEIATDATINPGNSGGPAYNYDERAVGVVIAISTDGIGGNYGYVISNDLIYSWFLNLANDGYLNPDFVMEVFSNDLKTGDIHDEFSIEDGANIFNDVDFQSKYAVAINYLKEAGIINGYQDGTFKPLNEINRAELLKVLILSAGYEPSSAYKNCFPDIQEQWFSSYVCFAKLKGWVSGYEDGTFKPEKAVSKAEALKMLFNVMNMDTAIADEDVFNDVKMDNWYTDFVYSAKFLDIIDDTGLYYQPNSNILRGQISEYLFRAINL